MKRAGIASALCAAALVGSAAAVVPTTGPDLSESAKAELEEAYRLTVRKQKGPYTQNYCVCQDGARQPVQLPDGRIVTPCGGRVRFCAAYRTRAAETLAEHGMYVANLFARDLHLWDDFPDPHDLVRGYILEKFLVETDPGHKYAELRAYGGLAGAEYEARAAPLFFERYLSMDGFREPRHYLLAYELQRRFFVRNEQGQIQKARNLATAIQSRQPAFKPLRDAVHNQITAALVPKLVAYRAGLGPGEVRDRLDELVAEVRKLTALDESALRAQLPEIEDAAVRGELEMRLPAAKSDASDAVARLADLAVTARRTVEAKRVAAADARRLVDVAITAVAVLERRATALVAEGEGMSARRHAALLASLTNAAYGSGLLAERERAAAVADLRALAARPEVERDELAAALRRAARVVEWAQGGVRYAFEEVLASWNHLLPQTALLSDDVLRASPLLVYGKVLRRLEDFAAGSDPIRHHVFGAELDRELRALNPGLAFGRMRVAPEPGSYSREEILALPETPADLEPAAGIVTRGEGNVVSHVQLLARALGIPNVVVGPSAYERFAPHDGRDVFFLVTPAGRVVVKDADAMAERDRAVLAEWRRSQRRTGDRSLGAGPAKLHIDRERLDLSATRALDLSSVRRTDSGVRTGPKAAFLGELRYLLPDAVARGVVVPFGAYHEHFRSATVRIPPALAGAGLAEPGEPLPDFVERTYARFFGEMMAGGTPEAELAAWIRPRLEIMRTSIVEQPIAEGLASSVRAEIARQGLLQPGAPDQTVGLFVRSDTNVEDLDEFNGAGLNLTLFNRKSVADVFDGIKQVWASPFTYRSFSWRQTLIDEPLWVLPSIVILESVPSEKSGVLVTADLDGGHPDKMLIATSEGVGGAVDGTSAETLLWSRDGVELVTLFKSPWRRMLQPGGGSTLVPSTGSEQVLSPEEVSELVAAASVLRERLAPSLDRTGHARPWDIEYGFARSQLWLFQVRPFVGNDSLKNLPALAAYDGDGSGDSQVLSLDRTLPEPSGSPGVSRALPAGEPPG